MAGGFGLVLFILAAIFYFIPTVIACKRNAGHTGTIFLINLLFGWTVLGWIAALIWAVVETPIEYAQDFDEATGLPRERD
jgi:T4 superinfection immunity protein